MAEKNKPGEVSANFPKGLVDLFADIASVPFKPLEDITVAEWADRFRVISSEAAAEPGPWRTEKTPYLRDIMDAFSDPLIRSIYVVSASQIGKSEFINNCIGYIVDQDPSSILFIHPTVQDARDYSKLRITPMFRDTPVLKNKIRGASVGRKSSTNTVLQKGFAGGIMTMCGSTEAHALASKPIRYVLGDERDRWATSAGNEGDPYRLALARQTTFYNAKSVLVSTPTIKGASPIEEHFYEGTQERWCSKCPHCGEYHNIRWQDIRYGYEEKTVNNKPAYDLKEVYYVCPECGAISHEREMKRAPAKWIPDNPDAFKKGVRSFWLNSFISPWLSWRQIVTEYLEARGDTMKLQAVYNTRFGELWEDRGGMADEDEYLSRREAYDAELPNGVLVLTMGVDVQDDRLEYEIVGWGLRKESWGIKYGQIMGRPDDPDVWQQLDDILNRIYYYADGKGLKISMSFIDDGGHYTMNTRIQCRSRVGMRLFDCKGIPGNGKPYIDKPKQVQIMVDNKHIGQCWQYQVGVDSGKQMIMDALRIQTPGPRYCHFPIDEDRGYTHRYFKGLLSERLVYKPKSKQKFVWEVIPGHERNEPLDCRDYAQAAFLALSPDMDAIHRRRNGTVEARDLKPKKSHQERRQRLSPMERAEEQMNKMMDW